MVTTLPAISWLIFLPTSLSGPVLTLESRCLREHDHIFEPLEVSHAFSTGRECGIDTKIVSQIDQVWPTYLSRMYPVRKTRRVLKAVAEKDVRRRDKGKARWGRGSGIARFELSEASSRDLYERRTGARFSSARPMTAHDSFGSIRIRNWWEGTDCPSHFPHPSLKSLQGWPGSMACMALSA